MGTPDFAVPTLDALVRSGHQVAAVYTQPPRPAGRGHAVTPSPVQRRAEALGIEVRAPRSLKTAEAQADFAGLTLDIAVVAAYGLILPAAVLAAPRHGCVNVHASLLPRWRGAAPIQRALLAGDTVTGVTIMQMDEGLDTGPMLARVEIPIHDDTSAGTLHDALATAGADLLAETLGRLEAGTLTPEPQPAEGATYATKIGRQEGQLDWSDAAVIDRQVRALNPWPGTWFACRGERIRITAAAVAADATGSAGTVLDDRLTIACDRGGGIRPLRLQRPGRSEVDTAAFLRGFPIPPGTRLCPATS